MDKYDASLVRHALQPKQVQVNKEQVSNNEPAEARFTTFNKSKVFSLYVPRPFSSVFSPRRIPSSQACVPTARDPGCTV